MKVVLVCQQAELFARVITGRGECVSLLHRQRPLGFDSLWVSGASFPPLEENRVSSGWEGSSSASQLVSGVSPVRGRQEDMVGAWPVCGSQT